MTTIIFKNQELYKNTSQFDKINKYINDFISILPEGISFDFESLAERLSPEAILRDILQKTVNVEIWDVFILLIFSVVVIFLSSLYKTKLASMIEAGAGFVFLLKVIDGVYSLCVEVSGSLNKLSDFFASLTPILVSVSLLGGEKNASGASAMQMALTSSVLQLVSGKLLIPLIFTMLSLGILSILGGTVTPKILNGLKDVFTKFLGLISTITAALFSLQRLVASATDSATIRLAKFTAQSLAPAAGAVITASMSTLASGIGYAKSVIGSGAIYAIILIMLSPMPRLLLYRFAVGICQGLADVLDVKLYSKGLLGVRYALDSLLSVYFIFGALFILQVVLFIKGGVTSI